MSSLKLFGALLEHGVIHNKETTSTSINPPVSSMHDASVHGLHNDRRSVHLEESLELIKKAATDAVEATVNANLEMSRLTRILGNIHMDNTTGHGSNFEVRLAPIAEVESVALEVAKASADAALHAKLMVEAAVKPSDVLEEHTAESDSEDVRRTNDLSLICKDINLAVKGLSDALGNLFTEEPDSLKSAEVVHFGPNDFQEEIGVTSVTRANPMNPTEDASSAKQAGLETPDSEADHRIQNTNLVQLDSHFSAERISGKFVPTRRKRKLPSSVKDVHREENVPSSSNTSEVEHLVSNTTPAKLMSNTPEPRRSSRKIQPTVKILEGLETECIPVEPLEKGNRAQRRNNSSQVSAESKEGK